MKIKATITRRPPDPKLRFQPIGISFAYNPAEAKDALLDLMAEAFGPDERVDADIQLIPQEPFTRRTGRGDEVEVVPGAVDLVIRLSRIPRD